MRWPWARREPPPGPTPAEREALERLQAYKARVERRVRMLEAAVAAIKRGEVGWLSETDDDERSAS